MPSRLLLIFLLLAGCATTTPWKSRVGNYTYNEAVRDYGPANSCESIDTGKVCSWSGGAGFDFDDKLVLVFDEDDYLTAAEEHD